MMNSSSSNKCVLVPLVECSETCDQEQIIDNEEIEEDKKRRKRKKGGEEVVSQVGVEVQSQQHRKASGNNNNNSERLASSRYRAKPSRSTDGVRPKRRGSRLSLASLFNFGGSAANFVRERSRSGWSSYSEDTVRMTSVSVNDIHSAVSNSITSKRYRGSDTESGMEGGSENCADLLLPKESQPEIGGKKEKVKLKLRDCPLCFSKLPSTDFPQLIGCTQHRSCDTCMKQYVELSINENRVEVPCPECNSFLHPQDITTIIGSMPNLIRKYEEFSVRKFLMTDLDSRWCPAPDCGYAVIAANCAACPQLRCKRDGCGTLFCYHCKREWHSNQTCDEARYAESRKSRSLTFEELVRSGQYQSSQENAKMADIKGCPRCQAYIVKMDDGSCNHMICTMCNAEFCWLCLREISDLHYLSPTGCTFWGKKPWTRKKKLLWQLGTLIGAPVGIALIAGLSIPGIIFGVPVFVGRKVHQKFKYKSKSKRRFLTVTCVIGSLVVSPVMAVMAVGVGVPIMLAYVYGVVPLSLCRNGTCINTSSENRPNQRIIDEEQLYGTASAETQVDFMQFIPEGRKDNVSIDPSVHSGLSAPNDVRSYRQHPYTDLSRRRISVESGERINYEEASVKAMSGSHHYDDKSLHTLCSGHEIVDEQSSTKALAGSVTETKSLSGRFHLSAKHSDKLNESDTVTEEHDEDLPSTSYASSSTQQPPCQAKFKLSTTSSTGFKVIEQDEELLLLSDEAASMILTVNAKNGTPIVTAHPATFTEGVDLSKIRGWLDNIKQMTASDIPQEKPYEPSNRSTFNKIRRSGSGKSVNTTSTLPTTLIGNNQSKNDIVNTSLPENLANDNVSITSTNSKRKKRLGFFSNWFNKSK
ncbi:unnamed protein product [Caenorhabditis angaria]|uniref:RBR-type E3 ubiquitin transferase n=1 Tax=Caenorhabditis angaria TaxID=860376 RepID=A0A9P1NAK5_9PELO|nr:unnamed protein product [Caenorhabditis angaria]